MNRTRRLLLFCPLLLLTLFFAAMGWRIRHASKEAEPVWREVPVAFVGLNNSQFTFGIGRFPPHQTIVTGIYNGTPHLAPLSPALFQLLKANLPNCSLKNATGGGHPNAYFLLGKPKFDGPLAARCRVFSSSRVAPDAQFVTAHETFHFVRSPLDWRGENWRFVKVDEIGTEPSFPMKNVAAFFISP